MIDAMNHEDHMRLFLVRYGQALSTGGLRGISSCWEVPALVLSDQGAIAVSEATEIEAFFGQAVEWYHSQGLVETKPQLERVELMGERLASVDVRWSALDEAGEEKAHEHSRYVTLLGDDGEPRIRVAFGEALRRN
jgi:hypothetical protein